jgi:MFS family permease
MICSSIIWTLLTLFIADLGASNTQIGLIRMISTAAGIFFGPSLGKFSDKIGRTPILITSMSCFLLYFVFSFLTYEILYLFPISLFEGIGYLALGMVAPSVIADIVPDEEMGWAMGTFTRIQNVGWLIGYGLGGYLADIIGFRSTFLFCAGLMIVSIFTTFLISKGTANQHLTVVK